MGTIVSPWRYDPAACCTLRSPRLRWTTARRFRLRGGFRSLTRCGGRCAGIYVNSEPSNIRKDRQLEGWGTWPSERGVCDVLVAGSGAGGFAAALTASLHGLDVIRSRRSRCFGGTTAYSAGVIWIPVNFHQKAAGVTDTERMHLPISRTMLATGWIAQGQAFQRSGDARLFEREYAAFTLALTRATTIQTNQVAHKAAAHWGRTNTMAGRLVRGSPSCALRSRP